MFKKERNVLPPVPKWRQFDWHDVEAIVKILPKAVLPAQLAKIGFGGSYNAAIHSD